MAEQTPFFWGAAGTRLTPEEILAQRKASQLMGAEASSTAPVGHWSAGLNRVVQGLMSGYDSYTADQASRQNGSESAAVIQALLGGGAPAAPVAAAPAAAPALAAPMGATAIPAGTMDPGLKDAISSVATARGVDPAYMTRLAMVESGGNPNAASPLSSARGPFQFINSTAKQYGLTNPNDPAASADAAARLTMDNKAALTQALGRDPTPGELYLAHQQGASGAARLLANPTASVESIIGREAAMNNGAKPGMTAGDFAGKWTGKFSDMGGSAPATAARPSVNPLIAQAMTGPYMSDSAKSIGKMLFQNQLEAQQKASDPLRQLQIKEAESKLTPLAEPYRDSDGNLVQKDPTGKVTMLAPSRTTFSDIGTDPATGNPIKGFVNADGKKVDPYKPPGSETSAPSTLPAVPPGVDPKLWREGQSKEAILKALPGSFDDTAKLRGEFTGLPSYKNLSQAAPIYRSMSDAAGRNTKAADLNMVYGLGKIMDPGSVVREGEIQMANNAQGWQEKLNGIVSQINNQGGLTPAGRQALMAEAYSRISAYKGEFDQDAGRFRSIAGRNRINADDVVPAFDDFKPWEAPKSGAPVEIDGYKIKAR